MPHARLAGQAQLAQGALGAAPDGDRRAGGKPLDQLAEYLGAGPELAYGRRAVRERLSRSVRVRRHDVPEHRVAGDPESRERAVHDRPRLLGPALAAQARRSERRAPPEQRALGRERDAREATAGVAHRLAHQQERRAARASVQVGGRVGTPQRSAIGALERRIGVAEHAEGGAERSLGDALDEAREPALVRQPHRSSRRRARAPR